MMNTYIKKCMILTLTTLTLAAFFGCSAKVNREIGQLNLNYSSFEKQAAKNDKLIALIYIESMKPIRNQDTPVNPLVSLLNNSKNSNSFKIDFNGIYSQNYHDPMRTAISNGLQDMLSKKGFNLQGPYPTLDDMSYGDKKKTYLSIVPVLNLQINDKITESDVSFTQIKTITGNISISGEMLITLMEPMTKERVMTKRINLSDFNISKNYIKQMKYNSGSLIINAMTSGTEIKDNSDKVLTDALNEFYSLAMLKIDKLISSEEILSYTKSVDELKGLKRF